MLTLYDAPRCPYCARTRIVLAEKGVPYETVTVDLENRPGVAARAQPAARPRAGARGGRLGAARVGRDRRVPRGAVPRAAAASRSTRPSARPPGSSCSGSTTSASRTTRSGARSRAADGVLADALAAPRRVPRGDAVPDRARVRARGHRVPAVAAAAARPDGRLRSTPTRRSRAGSTRAPRGRPSRPRSRRSPRSPRERRHDGRARRAGSRAGARPARRPASGGVRRATSSRRATRAAGHIPGARNVDLAALLERPDAEAVRALVGAPAGAEVIAYCHSGQPLGDRRAGARRGRVRGAQLRRLVARVVARPGAPGRARLTLERSPYGEAARLVEERAAERAGRGGSTSRGGGRSRPTSRRRGFAELLAPSPNHAASMSRSTSAWNWMPHTRSPSRNAWRAAGARRELDAALRQPEGVVVPLERVDRRGRTPRTGSVTPSSLTLDRGTSRPPARRPGRPTRPRPAR